MILCIETATSLCSVALCEKESIIALRESNEVRSHASLLTVLINELLEETRIKTSELEAIAVSKGPGSYTGLRIGVSTGKGIAYASSIPLIGIDTTNSLYYGFRENSGYRKNFTGSDLFCPVIDARRMEVYYSVLDLKGNIIKGTRAEIIDKNSFSGYPESSRIFIFGDGAAKCKGVTDRKNLIIDSDFRISSSFMQRPAYEAFVHNKFEDVAYFEPFYLKDFITSKPVKNIFGK